MDTLVSMARSNLDRKEPASHLPANQIKLNIGKWPGNLYVKLCKVKHSIFGLLRAEYERAIGTAGRIEKDHSFGDNPDDALAAAFDARILAWTRGHRR